MRSIAVALTIAALSAGCASNQADLTAVVQGIQDLESKHMALNQGFDQVARRSIEPSAQKEILLQRLSEDRSQFGATAQGLIRLLQTLGQVDYATLYQGITQTIWQIRFPDRPLPPAPTYYSGVTP